MFVEVTPVVAPDMYDSSLRKYFSQKMQTVRYLYKIHSLQIRKYTHGAVEELH